MAETIIIDKKKCAGCGACVSVCDKCFVMDGDKGKFIGENREHKCNCWQEAVSTCPEKAISIIQIEKE